MELLKQGRLAPKIRICRVGGWWGERGYVALLCCLAGLTCDRPGCGGWGWGLSLWVIQDSPYRFHTRTILAFKIRKWFPNIFESLYLNITRDLSELYISNK